MESTEATPHIRADPKTDQKSVATTSVWQKPIKFGDVVHVTGDEYRVNRLPYLITAPVIWVLAFYVFVKRRILNLFGYEPETNTLWFDAPGTGCRYLRKHNPYWRVLHFLYNHENWNIPDNLDQFWLGNCNAQAVWNRKKLAKKLLKREFRKQAELHDEVRIMSLASGSAQAVLKAVSELKSEVSVKVLLVDLDQEALKVARAIAERYGVSESLETKHTSVGRVAQIGKEFNPNVGEMIGFADYISNEKAIKYFKRIRNVLTPGGVFITCNIHPNFEMPFTHTVVDWPMRYRWPKTVLNLLSEAGFQEEQIFLEPHKIHGIGIGRKFVQNQRNGEPPARQREFQLPRKVADPVPKAVRKVRLHSRETTH